MVGTIFHLWVHTTWLACNTVRYVFRVKVLFIYLFICDRPSWWYVV